MKQLFIAFLIVLGLSACTNPEQAIKTYQQQKEAIGLQTPEKQNKRKRTNTNSCLLLLLIY